MKMKGKALFSLLLALALTLSLFSVSAYATGSEGLGLAVYLSQDGQTVPLSADNEYLLGGSCSVAVGDRALDGSFSIDALLYGDLRITPPEGWYVARAWLSGDGSVGSNPLPLTAADANGSTAVLVKSDAFIQSYDGYGTPVFNDAVLSSYGGYYTLGVLLAQRDPSDPVNITDNYGSLLGTGSASAPGESYQDGSVFVGWRLSYPNGASVIVQPGAYLTPYASCSLSPVFAAQVILRPADMTATAGDSLGTVLQNVNLQMLNLPGDMTVSGAYVSSDAGDPLQEGTYRLFVSDGYRLVDYSGKPVDSSRAVVTAQDGYLTVQPGVTYVEPEPVSPTEGTVQLYDQSGTAGSFSLDSTLYDVTGVAREAVTVGIYAVDGNGSYVDAATAPAGTYTLYADLYYDTELYAVNLFPATLTLSAPQHEHSWGEAVRENEVPASCTAEGRYDEVYYCTSCGEQLSRETKTIPMTDHTWGEPVHENEIPASCTAEGSYDEVYYCTSCGVQLSRETKTTPMTDHTWGEPVHENEVPASCEADGHYEEVVRCAVCGVELSRETRVLPATGHNWGDWVETTPATEEAEGVLTRTCLNDPSHTETQAIARLAHVHSLVKTERVPATCETDGTEEYWTCQTCGKLFSDEGCTVEIEAPAVIPATGHTPGEAVRENEVPATCAAEGSYDEVVYCTVCNAELSRETKTLEKLPHTPVKTERVDATCEADGVEEYWTCSVCGKLFSDEGCTVEIEAPIAIPAHGHSWGEWTVTVAATETTEGSETRTCQYDASHTETRSIPVLSHTHSLTKIERVEPTYEAAGNIEYYVCSGCGKYFSDAEGTAEINLENTVLPKLSANSVTVTVNDQTLTYTGAAQTIGTQEGTAYTVSGLAEGDSLTVTLSVLDSTGRAVEGVTNAGSYVIQATTSGFDTNKYSVSVVRTGTLTVERYPLTVAADPVVKTYDGTAVTSNKVTASLLSGHSFRAGDGVQTAVYDANGVLQSGGAVAVGTYTNKITAVHIVDGSSNEVTDNYALTLVDGTITVSEAPVTVTPVTITVENQTWANNGLEHALDGTKYSVAGLPAGEDIHIALIALDANNNPIGTAPASGTYRITATHQADAKKYNVTVVPGILTITDPVAYTLTDTNAAAVVAAGWAKGSTEGFTVRINADYSKFAGKVFVDASELATNCYTVASGSTVVTLTPAYLNTLNEGMHSIRVYFNDGLYNTTFNVNPTAYQYLTIAGVNVTKAYDGQPYNLANYGANSRSITASFHLAQNGVAVAQAVNPGSYDIYLDQLSGTSSSGQPYKFVVKNADGAVVSNDYQNTPVKIGTLTITNASVTPLTITVKDQSWTYDGTAHTLNVTEENKNSFYTVEGLQSGDSITVKLSLLDQSGRALSSVTNVGSYNIKAEYSGLTPGKYSVTIANQGTLSVTPYKLTLTAVSASKTYDGSLTFDKKSNVSATALLSGHSFRSGDGVKFSIYDSRGNLIKNGPVDVGTYTKKVTDVHIIDTAGNEVTSNYDITRIDGTLTILPGNGSPRTGDTNNIALWIGLLAASAVLIAAVAATLLRRKKKSAKQSDAPVKTRKNGR